MTRVMTPNMKNKLNECFFAFITVHLTYSLPSTPLIHLIHLNIIIIIMNHHYIAMDGNENGNEQMDGMRWWSFGVIIVTSDIWSLICFT
jgi:hypothetical protein